MSSYHDPEYIDNRRSHLELQTDSVKRIDNNTSQLYKLMKTFVIFATLTIIVIIVLVACVSVFLLWHDIQILQKIDNNDFIPNETRANSGLLKNRISLPSQGLLHLHIF